jgi:Kef-type K+ transport system membrane component KefB
MILHPLYLVGGSLVLAGVLAMAMLILLRLFGRRPAFQFSATVSLVLMTVAVATILKLSVPLSLLLLGAFGRLFDHERHFVSLKFGETAMLFIVLLFALAGASLEFTGWSTAVPLALAFVGARLVGKAVPILLLSNASGLALRKSSLVSLGLMPMSAVSLLMLHELMRRSPALASEIGPAMFLAIALLAFAGPLALEFSLRRCSEAAADTP